MKSTTTHVSGVCPGIIQTTWDQVATLDSCTCTCATEGWEMALGFWIAESDAEF